MYTSRVRKRAQKITLDPSHPSHPLFELLPSGRRFKAANTRTARHKNSFFPQAIYLMNSWMFPPLCNNLLFICYHLHPSTSLDLTLFYSYSIIYSTTVHTIYFIFSIYFFYFCLFIFTYVCICVCMCVCVWVCVFMCVSVCTHLVPAGQRSQQQLLSVVVNMCECLTRESLKQL